VGEGASLERILRTIAWEGDHAVILDQTALPTEQRERDLVTMEHAFEAIRTLQVRGAPLIGVTAAFGLYLGMREALARPGADPAAELARGVDYLAGARPTAVNLTWALRRAAAHVTPFLGRGAPVILDELLCFARSILRDDVAANRAMGVHGLPLVRGKSAVLTHCNAGLERIRTAASTERSRGAGPVPLVD
jgi:methylthioribose-1-phosphate isomerase